VHLQSELSRGKIGGRLVAERDQLEQLAVAGLLEEVGEVKGGHPEAVVLDERDAVIDAAT
jgi:hypothetical protein